MSSVEMLKGYIRDYETECGKPLKQMIVSESIFQEVFQELRAGLIACNPEARRLPAGMPESFKLLGCDIYSTRSIQS